MPASGSANSAKCPPLVCDLVARFAQQLDSYKQQTYNETQVRREFIDPFFKALGWDVDNAAGNAEAYKDVIHEDAIKVGGSTKAPDYCFRIGGARKFFVEAKKPSVAVGDDPGPAYQIRRYAWTAKLPLSIVTDFEELAVYDCRIKPQPTDKSSTARVLYVTHDEYAQRWDEIASIFAKDAILKGSFDKYAESNKRKRGTAEVDDEFLKEIEGWREELARNIALRNPGLGVRELNYAVGKIVDRIVFLRMCENRGVETYAQLRTLPNGPNIYPRLVELFRRADERYNSGLFHFELEKDRSEPPDELTPQLAIDDKVLKDIIKSLYYPDCPYEFSVMPPEILGQVYEQFLGKVIRLTKGHRAVVEEKPEVRKAGGVYYTPKYIVDYIVEHTVGKLLGNWGLGDRVGGSGYGVSGVGSGGSGDSVDVAQKLSGTGSLAKGDGLGRSDVPSDGDAPGEGAVRSGKSGPARRRVDPGQHRRRVRPGSSQGIPAAPFLRPGFPDGAGDASDHSRTPGVPHARADATDLGPDPAGRATPEWPYDRSEACPKTPDPKPLTPNEASKLRLLDPACGSGSFLLGAYQYLLDWHLKWYTEHDPEKWQKKRNPPIYEAIGSGVLGLGYGVPNAGARVWGLGYRVSNSPPNPNPRPLNPIPHTPTPAYRLTISEKKRILLNNIFGVDIDPQAVEVTKLSLLLKVLEGENAETIGHTLRLFHERALPDLADNIKCGNSLIGLDFYENQQVNFLDEEERCRINAFDWHAEFPQVFQSRERQRAGRVQGLGSGVSGLGSGVSGLERSPQPPYPNPQLRLRCRDRQSAVHPCASPERMVSKGGRVLQTSLQSRGQGKLRHLRAIRRTRTGAAQVQRQPGVYPSQQVPHH